jgi:hypothetical protein
MTIEITWRRSFKDTASGSRDMARSDRDAAMPTTLVVVKGRHTVSGHENTETGSEQWPGEQENELTTDVSACLRKYQAQGSPPVRSKGDLDPDGIDRSAMTVLMLGRYEDRNSSTRPSTMISTVGTHGVRLVRCSRASRW